MKFADLHVHTFYSDSTFSPEEVVTCAKDRGLSGVAICDHDTVDGVEPCMKVAKHFDIEIIPSIELTVEKDDAEIHMLGFFIDYKLEWLKKKLKELQAGRLMRIHKMVDALKSHGVNITAQDVFDLAGKGTVGRLHLANAMIKLGQVKNIKEAFEKYIGFRKSCYVANIKFTPKEAIDLVLKAGGVPVLAHPGCMNRDEYLPGLVECGLRGIEVFHTDHRLAQAKRYEELAAQYGLVMTGGSDCHGLGKGRIFLGEVRVPYTMVEKLREESVRIRNEYR